MEYDDVLAAYFCDVLFYYLLTTKIIRYIFTFMNEYSFSQKEKEYA